MNQDNVISNISEICSSSNNEDIDEQHKIPQVTPSSSSKGNTSVVLFRDVREFTDESQEHVSRTSLSMSCSSIVSALRDFYVFKQPFMTKKYPVLYSYVHDKGIKPASPNLHENNLRSFESEVIKHTGLTVQTSGKQDSCPKYQVLSDELWQNCDVKTLKHKPKQSTKRHQKKAISRNVISKNVLQNPQKKTVYEENNGLRPLSNEIKAKLPSGNNGILKRSNHEEIVAYSESIEVQPSSSTTNETWTSISPKSLKQSASNSSDEEVERRFSRTDFENTKNFKLSWNLKPTSCTYSKEIQQNVKTTIKANDSVVLNGCKTVTSETPITKFDLYNGVSVPILDPETTDSECKLGQNDGSDGVNHSNNWNWAEDEVLDYEI